MNSKITFDVNLGDLEIALKDRELSKDEYRKLNNNILGGAKLREELLDLSKDDIHKDYHVNLKSDGIYIQFDRVKVKEGIKDWSFMVRSSNWGGGNLTSKDWLTLTDIASKYSSNEDGSPSIRLTTRQTFQFHRVSKKNLLPLIKELVEFNKPSLNACGDNFRNPTACPMHSNIFDANSLSQKIGSYFQLPLNEYKSIFGIEQESIPKIPKFHYSEFALPRKLKIGIGGYYQNSTNEFIRCNCTDILTNDIAIAPILTEGNVTGYQVYVGGGLGQKNRKATFPALAQPFAIFNDCNHLIKGLDGIVKVQQSVGDRKNRHFARLKYVIVKKGMEQTNFVISDFINDSAKLNLIQGLGIEWLREQVQKLGVKFELPVKINLGELNRHHGWSKNADGTYSYGLWIPNGRMLLDKDNIYHLVLNKLTNKLNLTFRITAFQDILFYGISEGEKESFELIISEFINKNVSQLRKNSLACVGLITCPLAVAESERYFSSLFDELERRRVSDIDNFTIGISGCERHCSRNVRFDISIEGKADNLYQLKLLFGDKTKRTLAKDIIINDKKYLRMIEQKYLPDVIEVLAMNFQANRIDKTESMSEFHERIGEKNIFTFLSKHQKLKVLFEKSYNTFDV